MAKKLLTNDIIVNGLKSNTKYDISVIAYLSNGIKQESKIRKIFTCANPQEKDIQNSVRIGSGLKNLLSTKLPDLDLNTSTFYLATSNGLKDWIEINCKRRVFIKKIIVQAPSWNTNAKVLKYIGKKCFENVYTATIKSWFRHIFEYIMIMTSDNPTTVGILLVIDIFIDIFNVVSFDMNVKQYYNYEKKLDKESSVANVTLSHYLNTITCNLTLMHVCG